MTTRLVVASVLASIWSFMISLCAYAAVRLAMDGDPAHRWPAACFAVLTIPSAVLLHYHVQLTGTASKDQP